MIIIRLWHKDLIPYLPKNQLLGQWRECCCIAKNIADNGTPNHILVNKVLNYPLKHFYTYGLLIYNEMRKRNYKTNMNKFEKYFNGENGEVQIQSTGQVFKDWHNTRYLRQCLYNLQEKYDCGGITKDEYDRLKNGFNLYHIYT